MKKNYISPKVEIISIAVNDVITTSGGPMHTILVDGDLVTASNQGSQDFSIYG